MGNRTRTPTVRSAQSSASSGEICWAPDRNSEQGKLWVGKKQGLHRGRGSRKEFAKLMATITTLGCFPSFRFTWC